MARKSWLENLLRRVANSSPKSPRKRLAFRLSPVELLEDRLAPATVSLVGSQLKLDYAAVNEAVTIANSGTNITITGAATGTFTTASVNQITVTDSSNTAGQTLTFAAGTALTLSAGLSTTGVESVTLNDGISTNTFSVDAVNVTSSATGTLAVSTSATAIISGTASTLAGVISGAGSFTKDGTGTLIVSGANTYAGATNINAGILKLAAPTAPTSVSDRFFRFTPTVMRGPNQNSVQLSEMQFFNGTTQLTPVTATDIVGTGVTADPAAETPPNAVDNNTGTKWLNFGAAVGGPGTALIVDMGSVVTATQYRWATANDSPERDPIRWKMEGSVDGVTYVTLDDKTGADQTVSTTRSTAAAPVYIPGATAPYFSLVPAAGTANVIPDASAVNILAGATLDLNGVSETVASLAGAAASTVLNSNAATAGSLVLGGTTGTTTFSGSILTGGANGAASLSKTGASTLILNNPAPTYGASAAIAGGTLQLGDGTVVLTSLPNAPITDTGTLAINLPSGAVSSSAIISGAGGLTVSGAGALTLTGASTYSGATSIGGASTVNASGAALGTSTVTVAAGGTLKATANLSLGGLAGAGSANANGFVLTVGGNNASTSFTGAISGGTGSGLTKAGTGALTLGTNTFTGPTIINAGSVVATTNASLGAGTDPITVNSGGALALTAGGTYAFTKTLTIAGAGANGALKSLGGTTSASFTGPITVSADAAIGSDAGTFTLANDIALNYGVGNVTFTGAGDVVVSGKISPAAPPAYGFVGFTGGTGGSAATQNILNWTYTGTTNIDYSAAKGGFSNAATVPLTRNGGAAIVGNSLQLTDGAGSEARSAFAPITPSAFTSTFQFQFANPVADGFAFVLQNVGATALGGAGGSLGYNGIGNSVSAQFNLFSGVSTFGFGVNGAINHTIDLTASGINFHTLTGVNSDIFQADVAYDGAGGLSVTLKDVTTASTPATFVFAPTGLVKSGAGNVTLNGVNTYKGTTTINAGTLVVPAATALGTSPRVVVASGGTLGVSGGISLPMPITLSGAGAGGVGAINNIGGTNTIAGAVTVLNTGSPTLPNNVTVGAAAGVLNLNGPISLPPIGDLTFTGAGNINVAQSFGNGNTSTVTQNALLQQWYNTSGVSQTESFLNSMGTSPNGGLFTLPNVGSNFLTGPLSFANAAAFNASTANPKTGVVGTLADTFGFLWSGTFTAVKAGKYTFGVGQTSSNSVDDEMVVLVDLNNDGIFDNATERVTDTIGVGCCAVGATRLTPTFAAGESHKIAIAFQEFGGGEVGSATFSIAGDATFGTATSINPGAANQAGMWSSVSQPNNDVVKTGAGALTFAASNTYDGSTTVSAGTLNTSANNGLGAGPNTSLVVSGATTAVNLFNSATASTAVGSADFSAGAGTVNTGALGGKLAIGSQLKLANGIVVSGNMTDQGANLVDNAAAHTLSAVSGTLGFGSGTISLPATALALPAGTTASITPGTGGAGKLSSGNLSLATGATLKVNLNGAAAGTQYDQFNVTGTVNLKSDSGAGATLAASLGFVPAGGASFTIISNDGADPVQGTFAGLAQGATVTINNQKYTISYTGGDGNDVTLTSQALDWTGAVSSNWNVAGNWLENRVPTSNDTLVFSSATAGLVNFTSNNDIAGLTGLTIGVIDSNSTAGKDFTITGLGIGLANLINTKTDTATTATSVTLPLTGVGAVVTAAAGELSITGASNAFDAASSLNVPTGGIADVGVLPANSMGNAQFNLTGGLLNAVQVGTVFQNGFFVTQSVASGDSSTFTDYVPNAALGTDVQPFPMMADINVTGAATQLTNTRIWNNTASVYSYTGQIFFPNSNGNGTGTLSFAANNDDDASLYIDGVAAPLLHDTAWNVPTSTGPITLPTGFHNIDIRFGNTGGGAGSNNVTFAGNSAADWIGGNGSPTAPTGKGFGYRVDTSPTDPKASSLNGNDYKRLYATPTPTAITAATESGSTVTITTGPAHGLQVGNSVTIAGMTPAGYNGTFTVTAIAATTFTYTNTATGLAAATAFGTVAGPDDLVRVQSAVVGGAGVATNKVVVSGNSSIALDSKLASATFGALTVANGGTLNVTANGASGQSLIFPTAGLGSGATFNTGTNATLKFTGAVADAAAGTPGALTKSGVGSLVLSVADTYSGVTTVSGGVLVASVNGALGASTGATDGTVVSAGGQLQLKSNYTNTENLFLNGPGTTGTTNGALATDGAANYNFAGPIALQSNAWISASANTLTVSGGIALGANQLTLGGAGAVTVATTGISGTGILAKAEAGAANLNVASTYTGATNVTAGTLRVSVDAALGTVAGATNVSSGATLELVGPLTYATLEPINITGVGVNGVGALNSTTGNVTLAAPVALTGTGATIGSATSGSKLTMNGALTLPATSDLTFTGAGNIDVTPAFGNTTGTPVNNVIKNGAGVLTLLGANTYNGTTTINAGTLVPNVSTALGSGSSVVVNSGGTLSLPTAGGISIPATKTISITGSGPSGGGALANLGGSNTIAGSVVLLGDATVGSAAGTLTIGGTGINEGQWGLTVAGAGNTTVSGAIAGLAVAPAGLLVGQSNVNNDSALAAQPNPAFGRDIDLTPTMANKSGNDGAMLPTTQKTWASNDTWFYKGQIFFPNSNGNGTGTLSFAENDDDDVYMWIDGVQRLADTQWNVPTKTGPITLPTGFHTIEIRFSNGNGGAGANAVTPGWTTTKGFGYRVDLDPVSGGPNGANDPKANSTDGGDYTIPTDNGTGNLFEGPLSPIGLTKTGAGVLTLSGANTYQRDTIVSGGTVTATANNPFGTSTIAALTVTGATTVVNLLNSATAVTTVGKVNLSSGSGTVNTGALGGKLAIASQLSLANGYTVTGNMTAQGANLVDSTAPRTLSAVTGTLDIAKLDSAPIAIPDKGTLVINGTSQTNSVSYTANASAKMLVVLAANRSSTINVVPSAITYGGVPLVLATNVLSPTSTYTNSYIYYLMNPPVGANSLVVNWSAALSSDAVEVFTLSGVDTTVAPTATGLYNGASLAAITVSTNVPVAGSSAVTLFNYRLGTAGGLTETFTNGTPVTGGTNDLAGAVTATSAASGNLWLRQDTNIIAAGGLLQNLSPGSLSVTGTGLGTSGSFFEGAVAVVAPLRSPGTINLPNTSISLASGAKLSLNGTGAAVLGDLTVGGNVAIGAGANTPTSLAVGNVIGSGTGTLTINNNIATTAGGSAVKAADGTTLTLPALTVPTATLTVGAATGFNGNVVAGGALTLTGATQAVTIAAGTFTVNGTQVGAGVAINATGGALGGAGTVGVVAVAPGGSVAPGTGPGKLNTGNISFATGSTLKVDLNGTTAGTLYDQLNVTGTVNLKSDTGAGASLAIALGFVPVGGTSFTIINNDGADPIQGTFAGLAQGATVVISQQKYTISYTGGDGNDVVLTSTALNWTGAVSSNWNVAGNWAENRVPTSNDTLIFSSATPGLVNFTSNNDIAGLTGLAIGVIDSNSTAGKDFTIAGVGVGIVALTNSKTDTATPATATSVTLPLTGVGASVTATAGELSITGANAFDAASSLNVPTGGIADVSVLPANSMGSAQFNLTGGLLNVLQTAAVFQNGFTVTQSQQGNPNTFAAYVPVPSLGTDVQPFPMMADITATGARPQLTSGKLWDSTTSTYSYTGQIFIPNSNGNGTGTISFAENVDDDTYLYIDGNTTAKIADTQWNVPISSGPITLSTGFHDIEIRFSNTGGGAGPNNITSTGNSAADWLAGNGSTTAPTGKGFGYRIDTSPTDPKASSTNGNDYKRLYATPTPTAITAATEATNTVTITTGPAHGLQVGNSVTIAGMTPAGYNGTFTVTAITATTFTYTNTATGLAAATAFGTVTGPDDLVRVQSPVVGNSVAANKVVVSGNSTIALDTKLSSATFGALTVANGGALNVTANAAAGQSLIFPTAALGGGATFNTGANATLKFTGAVADAAAGTPGAITKSGVGSLVLGAADTYSGVTTVSGGVLVASVNGALGTSTGAADGTVVSAGGQLQLKSSYTNIENLSLGGPGTTGATNGALATDGAANYTFAGPIALQANAWISASGNALTVTGGIALGANQLTLGGAGTVTVAATGISGTGILVKAEGGTANLNVANAYTGATNVTGGTLRVSVDGALGTAAGATAVSSGATLELVGPLTYATLEPINITGTGVGGVGALNSTTGNVALAAPVALTGTGATIGSATSGSKLTLNGALTMPATSTLTFTGSGNIDVTPGFGNGTGAPVNNVVKNGAGVVTLLGTNTYDGTTTINAGTLVVPTNGALGSTTGVTVNVGGTLGVQGGVNLTKPLTLNGPGAGGVGAINNISGTNTIAAPLTTGSPVTIGSAAGALNVNGAIALANVADLTFTGAGTTNVAQSFGNGNASATTSNALLQQWYNTSGVAQDETFLNAMGTSPSGGLFSLPSVGSNLLKAPLNFANAAAFNASTANPVTGTVGTLTDTFGFLWTGTFTAVKAGTYTFGLGQASGNSVDDEMVILIDLNNDGVFSNATERVVDTIGVGCCGVGASRITPTFAAGESHRIAIAFQEFGGGEVGSATFSIAGDATFGSLTAINPGAANQAGMWSYNNQPNNNVIVNGAGTVTLGASNTYNGNTTVNAGTLATTANNALGSNPANTLTISGATAAVKLFDSPTAVTTVGTVDLSSGTGTVNTGPLGGKLAIANQLNLANNYTIAGTMTAQGANLVDNAVPRTLTAVSGTLNVGHTAPAAIGTLDNGQLFTNAANQNNTFTYTAATGAKALVVEISSRSDTLNVLPSTLTYNGVPLVAAVNSEGTATTAVNSHIYYLMNPPTGAADPLVVNFSGAINTSFAVYAFTLTGIDTTAAPIVAKTANTEGSPLSQALTVTGVPAGSAAIVESTYRYGSSTTLTTTTTSGTPVTTGTGGGTGNFWKRDDGTIIATGALITGLNAGSTTITTTAGAAAGSHWSYAVAVFKPLFAPAAVNLPATNVVLPTGATLSLNSVGANVLGDLTLTGNTTIGAGTSTPASLTVGNITSSGTLTVNNGIGMGIGGFSVKAADGTTLTLPVQSIPSSSVAFGSAVGFNGNVVLTGTVAAGSVAPILSVAAGTLTVNGALGGTAGTVVNNGATLAGTGSVGNVLALTGSSVAPAATGPGKLGTGDLSLFTGSTLKVDLNGAAAGTGYDQANVTGAVKLAADGGTGATLSAALGFAPAVGSTFTIINNDGADPVIGSFNGLAQGATFTVGTATLQISYTGGDGNDVVLTALAATNLATTTSLVATPLATTGGSPVQLTATVAPNPGAGGTVTFRDGATAITGGSNIAVVNGVAVFSTTALAAGAHSITAVYSGAAGFAGSTSNAQTVAIAGANPRVVSVTPNANIPTLAGDQHSRIASLVVAFDQRVTLDANAMALVLHTNNVSYNGVAMPNGYGTLPNSISVASTDGINWVVTFNGNTDNGADGFNSIMDGLYDLKIDATKVHSVGTPSNAMLANVTSTFHRLFGDTGAPTTPATGTAGVDFEANVNSVDNLVFRTTFNNDASYNPSLDFTGDGYVNSGDNLQFRARFNKVLAWKA